MRNNPKPGDRTPMPESFDVDADHFPTVVGTLRRLIQEGEGLEGEFEWIELQALANGEVTYRIRPPRSEELEGGILAAPRS